MIVSALDATVLDSLAHGLATSALVAVIFAALVFVKSLADSPAPGR